MSRKKIPTVENSFGGRLRIYRESVGLTISKFAELLGVSNGALSDIENNKRKPSFSPIDSIVRNTEINVQWLFTGEGEMVAKPEKNVFGNDSIDSDFESYKASTDKRFTILEAKIDRLLEFYFNAIEIDLDRKASGEE